MAGTRLGPPIPDPDKLLCMGLNYRDHAEEQGLPLPNVPQFLIFGVPEAVAFLSRVMTLEPGDVIATGTPAGVGQARDPQVWLRNGDVVEVELDEIGTLRNPVRG